MIFNYFKLIRSLLGHSSQPLSLPLSVILSLLVLNPPWAYGKVRGFSLGKNGRNLNVLPVREDDDQERKNSLHAQVSHRNIQFYNIEDDEGEGVGLEDLKRKFHHNLMALNFYMEKNKFMAKSDPLVFHFHRIRLKKNLIQTGAEIYEAEIQLAMQEKQKLIREEKMVPKELENKIEILQRYLDAQRDNLHIVENSWLENQEMANIIRYNKLKKNFSDAIINR